MKSALHVFSLAVLLSLAQAAWADDANKGPREAGLTLGAIQRSIKAGMSSTEVMEAAGSPNLVTRGRNGRESWVYDRFSTETTEQGVQAGGGSMGASNSVLGVLGISGGKKKSSTSQRTLMLMVTFGPDGAVESFSYRSSKF
ncbi:MAG: hypothetical protein ABIP62_00350 [Vicinamibacteria bacterium]